jgi:uncharacterized flavoprotein (TIGR03862 family)
MPRVAIIGGGPAGLMAAEVLAKAPSAVGNGVRNVKPRTIQIFDAMPSVGRKFLMAGKGGMNITHSEPLADFVTRYGERAAQIAPLLDAFGPAQLREWIHGLGIDTFVGTSGRVFPTEMKAAPLLRAWLHRLRGQGVEFHMRHRWLGWMPDGTLRFATPGGEIEVKADSVILALGGGSWAKLGSDGTWVPLLLERGVQVAPLKPANCGFDVAWSPYFSERFAGVPVKAVTAKFAGQSAKQGEFNITATGIEGGLIYAFSAPLREALAGGGSAALTLDLAPGRNLDRLIADLSRPRGRDSLANHLRRHAGIEGVKAGLLREFCPAAVLNEPASLATAIKALPLPLTATRPLDEAISTAGGVAFEGLDENLMLCGLPGVFCAGEMLDWEAPTGGYLLTACLASGRAAGMGAGSWLESLT